MPPATQLTWFSPDNSTEGKLNLGVAEPQAAKVKTNETTWREIPDSTVLYPSILF